MNNKPSFLSKFENRFTDASDAERFARLYGTEARYVPELQSWIYWEDKLWKVDNANIVRDRYGVRNAHSFFDDANDLPGTDKSMIERLRAHAFKCESLRKLNNVLAMAASKCITRRGDLDQGMWLLNVQNGTVNLKTGELQPHVAGDFITKIAPVEYAADADTSVDCPKWEKFMMDICCQRKDLLRYLKKMIGSALVGKIIDRHLYILYGASGYNGKTTLLEIVKGIMGYDYTSELPRSVIEDRTYGGGGGVTPELAKMDGARFVTVSETKDMRRLAVDLIKQLVGGGRLLVNPKYGTPYSFIPQATMCIETNRLPQVDGTDKALWSRLCPVPFDHEVPRALADPYLKDKILDEEAPVVLKWMVEGAIAWQQDGIKMPECVEKVYSEYQQESDPVGVFLNSQCVKFGGGYAVESKVLWEAYDRFAKATGIPEMKIRTFASRMSSPPRVIDGVPIERVNRIAGCLGGGWSGLTVTELAVPLSYFGGGNDGATQPLVMQEGMTDDL